MSEQTPVTEPDEHVLDVRGLRKPEKHPTIFGLF